MRLLLLLLLLPTANATAAAAVATVAATVTTTTAAPAAAAGEIVLGWNWTRAVRVAGVGVEFVLGHPVVEAEDREGSHGQRTPLHHPPVLALCLAIANTAV